jgi:hypothetical protein
MSSSASRNIAINRRFEMAEIWEYALIHFPEAYHTLLAYANPQVAKLDTSGDPAYCGSAIKLGFLSQDGRCH